MLLQGRFQIFSGRISWFQHNVSLGLDELLLVLGADDRGLEHGFVRDERGLDLDRRHPDAAHLEHVVRAAAVGVVAVLVEGVLVAAARPGAMEGVLGLLALVPVHERRGRAADLELAELARLGDDVALVIEEAHLVAGNRLAGRAVAHLAGAIGEEDVQHFGRADAVQDLDPGALGPALAEIGGKRFAGRGADS